MLFVALTQQVDLLIHVGNDHGAGILIFRFADYVGVSLDAIFRAVGQVVAMTKRREMHHGDNDKLAT